MLKDVFKFVSKGMTPQGLISSIASKLIINGTKSAYKSAKEKKKRREIEEKINYYSDRGLIQTIIIYLIGIIFCKYIISWGIIGIILVLCGYYGHFQNLKEAENYININREKVLSIISIIILVIGFI